MKRSYEMSTLTPFCEGMCVVVAADTALRKHFASYKQEIEEMSDGEIVFCLVGPCPQQFAHNLYNDPVMQAVFSKVPDFYYTLFKYCCPNHHTLIREMVSGRLAQWPILCDLRKRSSYSETSAARFKELCLLYSMYPRNVEPVAPQDVLSLTYAVEDMQYLKGDALFASFFAYQHDSLVIRNRNNVGWMLKVARLYALLYPFGCPPAALYTEKHHEVRTIASNFLKVLTASSLDTLKHRYPNDRSRYDPINERDSYLSVFLEKAMAVVNRNKEILSAAFLTKPGLLVTDDRSYEYVLGGMLAASQSMRTPCTLIDAAWLTDFIVHQLRPLLPINLNDERYKRYHPHHLTQDMLNSRLLKPLRKVARMEETGLLHNEVLRKNELDTAIREQMTMAAHKKHKLTKDEQQEKTALVDALEKFIDVAHDSEDYTLASNLFHRLRRETGTLHDFWFKQDGLREQDKLAAIYKRLFFDGCTVSK